MSLKRRIGTTSLLGVAASTAGAASAPGGGCISLKRRIDTDSLVAVSAAGAASAPGGGYTGLKCGVDTTSPLCLAAPATAASAEGAASALGGGCISLKRRCRADKAVGAVHRSLSLTLGRPGRLCGKWSCALLWTNFILFQK